MLRFTSTTRSNQISKYLAAPVGSFMQRRHNRPVAYHGSHSASFPWSVCLNPLPFSVTRIRSLHRGRAMFRERRGYTCHLLAACLLTISPKTRSSPAKPCCCCWLLLLSRERAHHHSFICVLFIAARLCIYLFQGCMPSGMPALLSSHCCTTIFHVLPDLPTYLQESNQSCLSRYSPALYPFTPNR